MQFGIKFRLTPHPHGKGNIIKITELQQIYNFFKLIYPYRKEIESLKYKYNFKVRLEQKLQELSEICDDQYSIKIASLKNVPNYYSTEDENIIINMKLQRYKDKAIADTLNRNYWGLVVKIRRLRKEVKLK